jgi:toxin ParE1/3/4
MRVEFSPLAQADLLDIAVYIAQDKPSAALSFVDALEAKCLRLGDGPGIGTARPELGDGLRSMSHGRYLIFYRPTQDVLRIERVMHSARDLGADDFEGDSVV